MFQAHKFPPDFRFDAVKKRERKGKGEGRRKEKKEEKGGEEKEGKEVEIRKEKEGKRVESTEKLKSQSAQVTRWSCIVYFLLFSLFSPFCSFSVKKFTPRPFTPHPPGAPSPWRGWVMG